MEIKGTPQEKKMLLKLLETSKQNDIKAHHFKKELITELKTPETTYLSKGLLNKLYKKRSFSSSYLYRVD